MKRVLVLENNPSVRSLHRRNLQPHFQLFLPRDMDEARPLLKQVDAVVIGSESFEGMNSLFVQRLSRRFRGPLIACSSRHNPELLDQGCSVDCTVFELLTTLRYCFGQTMATEASS